MSGGLGDVSLSPSCSHELGLNHMLHHKEFGNMQHMMGRSPRTPLPSLSLCPYAYGRQKTCTFGRKLTSCHPNDWTFGCKTGSWTHRSNEKNVGAVSCRVDLERSTRHYSSSTTLGIKSVLWIRNCKGLTYDRPACKFLYGRSWEWWVL